MIEPVVTHLVDSTEADFVFEVTALTYTYKITLTKDYYQKLTGGRVLPDELIKESFIFLLSKEPANNILPDFDLPLIQHYYADYEATMRARLSG